MELKEAFRCSIPWVLPSLLTRKRRFQGPFLDLLAASGDLGLPLGEGHHALLQPGDQQPRRGDLSLRHGAEQDGADGLRGVLPALSIGEHLRAGAAFESVGVAGQ